MARTLTIPARVLTWRSQWLRAFAVRGKRIRDTWGSLHTKQIEWVGLFATLWLRASLFVAAPALATVSASPVLTGNYDISGIRDGIWAGGAVWAVATAICAPLIVPRMLDRRGGATFPRALVGIEVLLSGIVLVALPSWPTAAFATGVLNLLQRPIWQKRRVMYFGLTAFAFFSIGAVIEHQGWTPSGFIFEVCAAALALAGISYCYGLMFPAFLRLGIVHPVVLTLRRHADRRRIERFALREAGSAVAEAERTFREILRTSDGDPVLRDAADAVSRARVALTKPEEKLWRRSFRLDETVKAGLFAVVPPAGEREDRHMHAYEPTVYPPQLREAILRKSAERALKEAVSEIAREADDHGTGRLRTDIRLEGDSIVVVMTNELGAPRPKGRSEGGRIIKAALARLPEGKLLSRNREESTDVFGEKPAFVVKFRFSTEAITLNDPRAVAGVE
jgi:hypothetical protein